MLLFLTNHGVRIIDNDYYDDLLVFPFDVIVDAFFYIYFFFRHYYLFLQY